MKTIFYLLLFVSISSFGYSNTVYYSNAEKNKWGDYSYKNKISKKPKEKLYYEVQYKKTKIYVEKHYNVNGKITYLATIKYLKNNKYIKYEYIKENAIVKVKIANDIGKYNMIKHFKINGNKKTLTKVEEYYENEAIQSISYYNNNTLYKQEHYDWQGAISYIRYYKLIDEKILKWKEEKYIYSEEGKNTGHWIYEYDIKGEIISEIFYPKIE